MPKEALDASNRMLEASAANLHQPSPMALEVLEQLVRCDPSDPLRLKRWIDEIQTGGADLVDIRVLWKK